MLLSSLAGSLARPSRDRSAPKRTSHRRRSLPCRVPPCGRHIRLKRREAGREEQKTRGDHECPAAAAAAAAAAAVQSAALRMSHPTRAS